MTILTPRVASAWTALSIALLGTLAWADLNGFVSSHAIALWAQSIVSLDGPANVQASDAIHAPIPYLLTLMGQGLMGGTTVPIPSLLSAGLGATLVLLWFSGLRREGGYGLSSALLAIGLLTLNPFFLRAVSNGPQTVLLSIGVWIYARGLVDLRRSGNAPDMMKVSVGLLLILLSDRYGLVICVTAMPFIIAAARPNVLIASPVGYLVAVLFPVVAAVGAMFFVAAIFDHPLLSTQFQDPAIVQGPIPHLLMLAGMAPILFMAVARTIRSTHHFVPLSAAMGTMLGAYGLNAIYPVEPDAAIAIAPMLSVVAVAIQYWPPIRMRTATVASLLGLGVALSLTSVSATPGTETGRWVDTVMGRQSGHRSPARDIAAFLQGKDNIMIDVERNPEIVVALGGTRGLLVSGMPAYDLAMQGGRVRAKFIVVRHDEVSGGAEDGVLLNFPQLENDALPNYAEIFQTDEWHVFGRIER